MQNTDTCLMPGNLGASKQQKQKIKKYILKYYIIAFIGYFN